MAKLVYDDTGRLLFTKEMKEEYTILMPQMLPVHFGMFQRLLELEGYKVDMLTSNHRGIIDEGLKYVHNDTCYPALLVIGQLIDAIKHGGYDPHKVALFITQTGGGCRASNYIHLLRKALVKAGYGQVPVVSLNFSGLEKDSGFPMTLPLMRKLLACIYYGDLLVALKAQTEPYETHKGDAAALQEKWLDTICGWVMEDKGWSGREIKAAMPKIAAEFAAIPVHRVPKVKVGVVGEIYVKYSPLGNNDLEKFLASQDCEVNLPGLMGFVQYCAYNPSETARLYGGTFLEKHVSSVILDYIEGMEKVMIRVLKDNGFHAPLPFQELVKLTDGVISTGNKMGEGWLLTAEMIELVRAGYENIVCAQPFGCLPNHICGKGMINKIRELYPQANITPIDYDPSATRVNQENRIKLMLAVARERLAEKTADQSARETPAPAETPQSAAEPQTVSV
ncbi:2-hydroxyglutaryl-CoA dehydratase [Dysosmobacter welbionis]|uniref:2-hydroxyglutaryl-CoA dehydratase n=1 Tax=Dysosmobacter welbionis TaxID=2093857 RepID=UPI00307A7B25